MAEYKAISRGYDNVKLREPGEKFQFSGKPGKWMEPVDEEAKKAFEAAFPKKARKAEEADASAAKGEKSKKGEAKADEPKKES